MTCLYPRTLNDVLLECTQVLHRDVVAIYDFVQ